MEFRYEAVGAGGQATSGRISADSESEAMRMLQNQGLVPIEIGEVSARGGSRGVGKATEQGKRLAIRELATLLAAGVPLGEAVESLAQAHEATQIGEAFSRVQTALRDGRRFSVAVSESGLGLPPYVVQLSSAAELAGKLAEALADAATQMEYEEKIRQEIRGALTYPTVLVFSGIGATLLIFVVVVPKFATLLKSSHAHIPAISLWVLQTGLFVRENLLWIAMTAIALAFGAASALSRPHARERVWQRLARLPVLGSWLVEMEIGRWAALLGMLLENRVPIVGAMELAQDALRLGEMRLKLEVALRELRAGKRLAEALASTGLFATTGLNLVRVGERSGELAAMLRTLATLHETAARERMKRFLALLEPVAVMLIGAVIGTIMIAIMMAITGLSTSAG